MSTRIFVAIGTDASGTEQSFVGTEADVSAWLVDAEVDPDLATWRELTPGELADLNGTYDGYDVPTTGDWFPWSTCWCTWCALDNAYPHWRWCQEADYPDHAPSTEWNLPEPTEGAA